MAPLRITVDTQRFGNRSIADAIETKGKEEDRRKQPGLTTLRIETILNAQSDAGVVRYILITALSSLSLSSYREGKEGCFVF